MEEKEMNWKIEVNNLIEIFNKVIKHGKKWEI